MILQLNDRSHNQTLQFVSNYKLGALYLHYQGNFSSRKALYQSQGNRREYLFSLQCYEPLRFTFFFDSFFGILKDFYTDKGV